VWYALDTEFFERPVLTDAGPSTVITPISLALISADGREYYAELDFRWDALPADGDTPDWLRANVLPHLRYTDPSLAHLRKTHAQVAAQLRDFVPPPAPTRRGGDDRTSRDDAPMFYAHYAAYDWVVLASLFGRMLDLPTYFPKHCLDFKQVMYDRGITRAELPPLPADAAPAHHALHDARELAGWLHHVKAK
jgi:hypothetical protein